MTITVGKKWDRNAHYIGRGSPLGNPFVMTVEHMRDEVCDRYAAWFHTQVANHNQRMIDELYVLRDKAAIGDLVLGCYYAPKRCHGDTIKGFLTKLLEAS